MSLNKIPGRRRIAQNDVQKVTALLNAPRVFRWYLYPSTPSNLGSEYYLSARSLGHFQHDLSHRLPSFQHAVRLVRLNQGEHVVDTQFKPPFFDGIQNVS